MYSEPLNNSNGTKSAPEEEEVEVTIRNLPNEAKTDDILEYLAIAGPIKSHKFTKEEERCKEIPIKIAPPWYTTSQSQHSTAKNIWGTSTTKAEC